MAWACVKDEGQETDQKCRPLHQWNPTGRLNRRWMDCIEEDL